MKKHFLLLFVALLLATLSSRATVRNVPGSYATIQAAVTASVSGDEIQIAAGTFPIGSTVVINVPNITITGAGVGSTLITGDMTAGQNFFQALASDFKLQDVEIIKTDKPGVQNLIWINANNASILNNSFHGQFDIGDNDVSRALVVSGGLTGLLIDGNSFYGLRQPGYFSGPTTGIISNNYTYGTKGWVMEGGDMTFTGNTWGVNVYDIAILSTAPPTAYTDIVAMSNANNDAVIEDQRVSPAVLSVVYVDANSSFTTDLGGRYHPYSTITPAVTRVVARGTINVAAGTYGEMITIGKSLTLKGANAGVHPTVGTHPSEVVGTRGLESILSHNGLYTISPTADNITVDGFKFTGQGGRLIDTYSNANSFHLTNCIFTDNLVSTGTGMIQFGGGSHNNMLIDFNSFKDKSESTIYTGGGPFNNFTVQYNKFQSEGNSIFWTASALTGGVIDHNEFDGESGTNYNDINIGQAGNLQISGNWFHDILYTAIQCGIVHGSVSANKFETHYGLSGYSAAPIQLWGGEYGTAVSTNVSITSNEIHYNQNAVSPVFGIRLRGPNSSTDPKINGSTIHVHDNSFFNGGVRADAFAILFQGDQSTTVDATCNWWASESTPLVYQAPSFTGSVTFIPYSISNGGSCMGGLTPAPIATIGTPTQTSCGTYDVPVTVQNFTNVGAISLILKYNSSVLTYTGVDLNSEISSSIVNGDIAGEFRLSYEGTGKTLDPDAVLFTLHFNLLPAVSGNTTNFNWSTNPGDCEFAAPGGNPIYSSTFTPLTWTIPARPVVNTSTHLEYCTIQAAINDDATLATHTLTVDAALYTASEQVLVNKEVTIKGINGRPTVDFLGTVTGKPTLFDISANNVTIDNIHFNVDLAKLKSAIIATAAGIDNITVKNNVIDCYGTPSSGTYGDRNAVSINYGGSTNYRIATGGVDNIIFTDNTVNAGTYPTMFRSGISVDEGEGTFSGNTLKTINQDIVVRFANSGSVTVSGNHANGGGMEFVEFNAGSGSLSITGNFFDGTFANTFSNALRLKNNYTARPTVVSGNTFTGFVGDVAGYGGTLSLENYQTVTLDANTFTPLAGSTTYRHITLNTKDFSSSSGFYAPVVGAIFTNNIFNGSGTPGGTALAFYNWDNDSPVFNAITIGTAGNENIFNDGIGKFIVLDGSTGTVAPNATAMVPWSVNLDAQNNKFALPSPTLPSAMSLAQLFALEDKIDHKIDNSALGFVTVKVSNAYVTDIASATALNNDYTRIRNAVELVANNWNINLHGTFDWTESNAAASWALGNDGVSGNDDDYIILVPANLTGVTFTAPEGLGNATIQGPGDLPGVNLEGTLNFWLGNNQNWTISNLNIFDFDLAIGMFNKGTTDYNNTIITNNHIRIPKDLNTTVAPLDVNQNIGIHYSFGTNQTISNNTFEVAGDGISNGTNYSTSVVMQSNTSGGTVYDGLKIKDNTITVTGVPDTNPAVIRGIWENGANSDAAIEISGNKFSNVEASNTADLNRQVAFWVTSISGTSKKVEYKNNEVSGFNEGVAWIGGAYTSYGAPAYQTGQFPVEIMNNKFDGMKNSVVVRKAAASTNAGSPALIKNNSFTNFVSGGLAIKNEGTGDAVSTCNWFGSVVASEIAAKVSGTVTHIPWLVSGTDASADRGFQPAIGCDETPPVFGVLADVTVNQHQDKDPFATGYAPATDNSGQVTITYDDNRDGLNSCNATGSIVRTWTATDAAGNTATKVQTITVVDIDNPVVVVPADITKDNDAGLCSAVVTYPNPTATDFGFFQGFEDANWVAGLAANNPSTDWNEYNSQITRVVSGTDGIVSKSGIAHAVVNTTTSIAANETGAMSRLGGYNGTFGAGFVSSVDVYFDMNDPGVAADTYGWDLDQAVSNNTGGFLRDFVYHVGGDPTGIYVCVSNNSSNGLPRMTPAYIKTQASYATITTSGWYTMKWEARNNEGFMAMDFTILDALGTQVWTTTINTTDAIASVGGNRYMWFNFVSANKLAIDNTSLTRKLVVTTDKASGTAFAKGETTVTATAADACGHSVSNTFKVTVVDAEAPVITACAPAQSKIVTDGCSVAMPDFTANAVATDNCPGVTKSQVPAIGTSMDYDHSPYTVTIRATDAAGLFTECTTTFTVQKASISGTLKYNNADKIPMNKVKLRLLDSGGNPVGSDVTTADGTGAYSFTGLCAGTYTISVIENNKDVGGINSTDAAAVNLWGTSGGAIEYVNFLAGDVTTAGDQNLMINNQDALRIQKYFVYGAAVWPFQRDSWSYWKKGVIISNNYGSKPADFAVTVSGADVPNFDLYGMCTGDFNGSLVPTTLKSATWSMELANNSTMNAVADQEFELPIRAASAMQVGAISMILQIPSGLVNVQNVLVNGSTVAPDWAVNGDELRIGWYSSTPVNVKENGNLLTLKLKSTSAFTVGESMEFALKFDPLNELADGNSQVISDAKLLVAMVGNGVTGILNPTDNNGFMLNNYPNPFKNSTTISYALPVQGKIIIQVYNSLGQLVKSLVDANQNAGDYSILMDSNDLNPGIYIAKLRLTNTSVDMTGTVKLSVLK